MWNALIQTAVLLTLANAKSVVNIEKNTTIAGVIDAAMSTSVKLLTPSNLLKSTSKELVSSGVPKCGGTIRGGTGSIQYKPFETAGSNERCVWIIHPDSFGTNQLNLRLDEFSSQPPAGTLTALGLGINGAQTTIIPSHNTQFLLNSSVLVITFATKAIPNTRGFALLWSSGWGLGFLEPASHDSREVLVDSPLGHLKHPLNVAAYSNLEVSVFAFVPQGKCTDEKQVEVLVNLLGLDFINDFVTYFKFYDNKWLTAGRIYYWYEPQLIRSDDIILLVFTSDASTTNSGFELTYSMC